MIKYLKRMWCRLFHKKMHFTVGNVEHHPRTQEPIIKTAKYCFICNEEIEELKELAEWENQ